METTMAPPATASFPYPVVEHTASILEEVPLITGVVRRPLRPVDPSRLAGVFPMNWSPRDHEIGQHEPALQTYNFAIQVFVKHANEEEGIAEHVLLAKTIREMLYRNTSFRVGLSQLNETSLGVLERVQRWGGRQQRYIANEINNTFLYLSVTEFWVETETVPAAI